MEIVPFQASVVKYLAGNAEDLFVCFLMRVFKIFKSRYYHLVITHNTYV